MTWLTRNVRVLSAVSFMQDAASELLYPLLPIYLTVDIDALDPAFAPATGTPVVGGLSTALLRGVLHRLYGMDIVGADIVEVAPHYEGPAQITAVAGATIAQDLLHLLAGAPRRARLLA